MTAAMGLSTAWSGLGCGNGAAHEGGGSVPQRGRTRLFMEERRRGPAEKKRRYAATGPHSTLSPVGCGNGATKEEGRGVRQCGYP